MREKAQLGSNSKFFGHKLRLFGKFTNSNFFGRSAPTLKTEFAHEQARHRYGEEMDLFINEDNYFTHDLESKPEPKDPFLTAIPIIALYFSIEFASALEIVYITPYFLKLELNDLLDATFWMIPVLLTTILAPVVCGFAQSSSLKRVMKLATIVISALGCFAFAYFDQVLEALSIDWDRKRMLLSWLGLIAFCFIDVANEIAIVLQNQDLERETSAFQKHIQKKILLASSVGRILGYFCGSLQVVGSSLYNVLENNINFSFFCAGFFMVATLIASYCWGQKYLQAEEKPGEFTFADFKKELQQLIPIPNEIKKLSSKARCLLMAHFFGASNILMLSVYATSWVAQDLFKGDPYKSQTSGGLNILFDIGVSWGAFALFLTSFVILLAGFIVDKMTRNPKKSALKYFYIFSQLLAVLALFSGAFISSFDDIFMIFPLTGFAFQTFQAIPEALSDCLGSEKNVKKLKSLQSFVLFYAQVFSFVVIPLFFLLFPDRNDNLWGMSFAGFNGLLCVIFAMYI